MSDDRDSLGFWIVDPVVLPTDGSGPPADVCRDLISKLTFNRHLAEARLATAKGSGHRRWSKALDGVLADLKNARLLLTRAEKRENSAP